MRAESKLVSLLLPRCVLFVSFGKSLAFASHMFTSSHIFHPLVGWPEGIDLQSLD